MRAEAAIRRRYYDGEVLGEAPMGEAVEREFGAAYWCLHRADLHGALVQIANQEEGYGPPVEIHLGAPVADVLSTGPDEARVVTEAGDEFAGNIVIGADGFNSVVREKLFGPQPKSFSGRVTNRHVIELSDLADDEGSSSPCCSDPPRTSGSVPAAVPSPTRCARAPACTWESPRRASPRRTPCGRWRWTGMRS